MSVISTWDINGANITVPASSLIENGLTESEIFDSGDLNYLLNQLTAAREPTGALIPVFDTQGTIKIPNAVISDGRFMGSKESSKDLRGDEFQDLFYFLWEKFPNIEIDPSRGLSAEADWTDNKSLKLPELYGVTLAGKSATPGSVFDVVEGSIVGDEDVSLVEANNPAHTHLYQPFSSDQLHHDDGGAKYIPGDGADNTESAGLGTPHNNVQQSLMCFLAWIL